MMNATRVTQFLVAIATASWSAYASDVRVSDRAIGIERSGSVIEIRNGVHDIAATLSAEGLRLDSFRSPGSHTPTELRTVRWGRGRTLSLAVRGRVSMDEKTNTARLVRPGITEVFSTSLDGLRHDYILTARPDGNGRLFIELSVAGGDVIDTADGPRIELSSGRRLTYDRLRVVDAAGTRVPGRIEVRGPGTVVLSIDDSAATYPLHIDPTISNANWVSLSGFLGADDDVLTLLVAGTGDVYAGGLFHLIGNVNAQHMARWDGSQWLAMGSGSNNNVYGMIEFGGYIFVGGYGSPGGYFGCARWNLTTNTWSSAALPGGAVRAFAIYDGELYCGGDFAPHVAKWTGSSWTTAWVGSGPNGNVYGMAATSTDLYISGVFTSVSGVSANYIARWNGSAWSDCDVGLSQQTNHLASDGTNVYAAGGFSSCGANPIVNTFGIARFDGTRWYSLGTGLAGGSAYALTVDGTDVYVGGNFTSAGGTPASKLAVWTGASFSEFGGGIPGAGSVYPRAIAVSGGTVYVGGRFLTVGGKSVLRIAKYAASTWSAMGDGVNARVYALSTTPTGAYAGGQFTRAGSVDTSGAAELTGTTWSADGSGTNSFVYATAVSGSTRYIGGSFTIVSGVSASRVARYNGGWSAMGAGVDGTVRAVAVSGSNVYVGGEFSNAGGSPASRIALWNGASWSPLGLGVDGTVRAIVVDGSDVYVGGDFNNAGGSAALKVAWWNGSTWSPMGGGMNATVNDLAISGSTVYAGGSFTVADGAACNRIAEWSSSSWSSVGSGTTGTVQALAVSGQMLYAGGNIATYGGLGTFNYIAAWNGTAWSYPGSGVDSTVHALAATGPFLYVGGQFDMAGAKVSPNVALLVDPPAEISSLTRLMSTPTNASTLTFRAIFDEPVSNVDASDFSVAASGVTYGTVDVTGSGTTYTITVDSVAGDGTLGVNLLGSPAITDYVNQLVAGPYTGATYTVDNTSPTCDTTDRLDPTPTNATSVQYTATFSETVNGVTTATFILSTTGDAAGTVASVTGSGSTRTVTVNSLSGTGTITLILDAAPAGQDTAGNAMSTTQPTSQAYSIDLTPPLPPVADGPASTSDRTPTWTWTAGGGGSGTFRHQLDSEAGAWTTTAGLEFTPPSAIDLGLHTIYVQERDAIGNWSTSGTFDTTIVSPPADDGGGCVPGHGSCIGMALLCLALSCALSASRKLAASSR